MITSVPMRSVSTLYSRVGDLPAYLSVIFLVGLVVLRVKRKDSLT